MAVLAELAQADARGRRELRVRDARGRGRRHRRGHRDGRDRGGGRVLVAGDLVVLEVAVGGVALVGAAAAVGGVGVVVEVARPGSSRVAVFAGGLV